MTAHTTSSRVQSTEESPSSSSSCPPLVRCAMVGGALGLLSTAGWLVYLGWAVAVSAVGPFAFLIWIEYVVVGLFWILGIALIIEAIALIHTYTRRSGQRYHEEGFGLGVTLLYPLLAGVEIGYRALIQSQSQQDIMAFTNPLAVLMGIIMITLGAIYLWYQLGRSASMRQANNEAVSLT